MFFEYFYLVMFSSFVAPICAIVVDEVRNSSIFYLVQREDFFLKQDTAYFGSLTF
jgi:hypothetical protein